MKIKCFTARFAIPLVALTAILCSCGKNQTSGDNEPSSAPEFPVAPDKIIIGVKGEESELTPEDEAFDKIMSKIRERKEKDDRFDAMLLDAYDPYTGEHLSRELKKSETFVEFIYNECRSQKFNKVEPYGEKSDWEIDVQRIFFSLSGEYHDCFFIGSDADYKTATTLGMLADDTSLVVYVRDLVEQKYKAVAE